MISASIKEGRKDNYGKPCIDVEIRSWQLKHFSTLEDAHIFMNYLLKETEGKRLPIVEAYKGG